MEDLSATVIDEIYEFSAPKFFDFINGESDQEKRNAELWFETALSHAPSRTFLDFQFLVLRFRVLSTLDLT